MPFRPCSLLNSCYDPLHPFGLCHSPTVWSEQFRKKCGSTLVSLILDTEPSLLPGVPGPLLPSPVSRAVTPDLSLPCISHRPLLPPGCQNPIRPPGPGAAPPPAGSPAQPLDVPGAVTWESRRSPRNSDAPGPARRNARCALPALTPVPPLHVSRPAPLQCCPS